ncbi:Protein-disulfide isomerase [Nonomuraea pusilla]|uniref:Protein-disulfide isomerase n=1 Tax=Nonomuraea pusilla TaxID=46177 RepID=A0A1H7LJX8_9ACTN|nr:Protein-disulfide isomerase [Nonomuraea pusilla]
MDTTCILGRVTDIPSSPSTQVLEQRLRTARIVNVVLAVVAVFLLIVVLARPTGGGAGGARPAAAPNTATPGPEATPTSVALRDPDDPLAIGPVDAPVVLVEWADLRCPYCALFTNRTMPALLKEYVDTGRVRYEFRDVSFFGEQSTNAAVAVRAAAEQGRFREYLAAAYAAAPEKGHPDLPRKKLIGFARTAGVPDLARFERDLDRADLRKAVEQSTRDAQSLGITSVPFFVAGDRAVPGAQPVEVFRQLLDDRLAAAGTR